MAFRRRLGGPQHRAVGFASGLVAFSGLVAPLGEAGDLGDLINQLEAHSGLHRSLSQLHMAAGKPPPARVGLGLALDQKDLILMTDNGNGPQNRAQDLSCAHPAVQPEISTAWFWPSTVIRSFDRSTEGSVPEEAGRNSVVATSVAPWRMAEVDPA